MANANPSNTTQTTQQQPKHFNLVKCISISLLVLMVLVGLAVLITWLIINPKKFVYTIENGSIQNFSLANNHLNVTFDFVIKAYNPNSRISLYYDNIISSVIYEDQTLAFNTIDPFFQPHRNVTRVESKLVALNLAMSPSSFKDLRIEKASRDVEVDLHFRSRIRVKIGSWKSKHRTLKIVCSSIRLHLSFYKHFDKVPCEVEL